MIRYPDPSHSRLAAACIAIMLPHSAFAQAAPDRHGATAAGYPCAARLGVFGDGNGFSIRPAPADPITPPEPKPAKTIRVGAALNLDATLLGERSVSQREADHDARR